MIATERKIYTVSRLNQEVQKLLESGFGTLWLQGELSNFSRPASGHFYFTLKDSQSQIRCAMFKGRNRYVDFEPQNGDAVLVRGKLGLYSARGDFQLIAEHMEPAGAGKLQAEFERTKKQLDAQGWFSAEYKKPLPKMPQCIGIVTSPTGAAVRDVLQVLKRRCRQARVIIYPTLTQGAAAAPALCRALLRANDRREADVLLLVRGGGSLEDLWAFNEVSVAQAIRESRIPVVAGIGHEVDITISDLVSDLRAPTPSAAAELATPDASNLIQQLGVLNRQLSRLQTARLRHNQLSLEQSTKRLYLRHPEALLRERAQRLDELQMRLMRVWQTQLDRSSVRFNNLVRSLTLHSPAQQLMRYDSVLAALEQRLNSAMYTRHADAKARFELLIRTLHSVSPLAVLDRGYALIKKDSKLITKSTRVNPGDEVTARLSDGEILAVVKATRTLP
jgi:exodeoxyribonuclease VII large subunit